jgi:pyruvate dehydrogenase complex dehydrogenase (E1) component
MASADRRSGESAGQAGSRRVRAPTINRVRGTALGVTRFGQSGDLADVYRYHGIDADSKVRAVMDVLG